MPVRVRISASAALTVALITSPLPTLAATSLVGGGGYDLYQGPGGQFTRSMLGIVGAGIGGGSASLTLMRYFDNRTGDGLGFIGALGVPISSSAALRVWGSRFVGDDSLRAWRVKAGPLVQFSTGGTAGFYYSHAQDNAGGRSDAAAAEFSLPISARITGRAGVVYATAPGGLPAAQGSLGLGWAPVHGLELSGEFGLARNGAQVTSPGPSRGPLTQLLGGGGTGGGTTQSARVDPLLQLSVRVLLP